MQTERVACIPRGFVQALHPVSRQGAGAHRGSLKGDVAAAFQHAVDDCGGEVALVQLDTPAPGRLAGRERVPRPKARSSSWSRAMSSRLCLGRTCTSSISARWAEQLFPFQLHALPATGHGDQQLAAAGAQARDLIAPLRARMLGPEAIQQDLHPIAVQVHGSRESDRLGGTRFRRQRQRLAPGTWLV